MAIIDDSHSYIERLLKVLSSIQQQDITDFIKKISSLSNSKKTIFIAGNGGSASTSSHMACDLSKTIIGKNTKMKKYRFRVISLADNTSVTTAIANDLGYENIFSEQIKNLGQKGDMLIVITASGNSQNIINAVLTAKSLGIYSYGIVGFGGGKVKKLLDRMLLIDSYEYGLVEDAHLVINHIVTDWFRNQNLNEDN